MFPQISHRSVDIGAQDWAQGEPPPLLPTSGVRTEAQRMGWTGTTRTRPWTGMPRACGARILSRASRRPSLSTLPVAGGKSFCQMKGRCTVSTLRTSQTKQIESMCASPKWAFLGRCMHMHSVPFFLLLVFSGSSPSTLNQTLIKNFTAY